MLRVLLRLLFVFSAAAGCALVIGGIRAHGRGDRWFEAVPLGRQRAFDDLILEVAHRHHLPPELLKAIAWHESRFDPTRAHDGGYGLMQIGAGTSMEWAAVHRVESFMVNDLFDPRTNLQVGSWYIQQLLESWRETDDPTVFALAEWVAGGEAVQEWAGREPRADLLRQAMKGTEAGGFVERVLERARVAR